MMSGDDMNFTDFILSSEIISDEILEFHDVNFEESLSIFSFIPNENRLAHAVGCRLILETTNIDLEDKLWCFDVKQYDGKKVHVIKVRFIDNDFDLTKYKAILQICLNGDMETKENLDKLGRLTGVSAWRCSYCGGVFGKTYNDCVLHEEQCPFHPQNRKHLENNEIEDDTNE